jgi:hypothetical protein
MTIIDQNRIPVIQAVSDADGKTVLPVKADPVSKGLCIATGTTGTDKGGNPVPRDDNRKVAFFAVSAVDGVTPVAVYCDATTGALLVKTT